MAGQRQPTDLVVMNGRKHLTKAEIEARKNAEVVAPNDKVKPPSYLTPEQKKKFRKIAKELLEIKLIANVDCDALARLWDLGEVDENFSDDDAEGVTLSLQVTIFSESDEVELAREIKKLMKEKDFSFEGRNGDDSKPEDGIYMKAQRFSKFYEMEE